MPTHLGAGALCQICFEPFGQLEELKAPYVITCGHVFCFGCLNNSDPCCRICGMSFDRQTYSRLLALNGHASPRAPVPASYDQDQLGQQLQESIALVNEHTNAPSLHHLHERARFFLDSQPRNRFRDLETSVRLLGYRLQAKGALEAQSQLISVLTEKVHRLNYEKSELQMKLDEMERQHAYERASVMDRIPDLMRKNPDFDLLTDEVIAFRAELNDLKTSVHRIRNPGPTSSPIAPSANPLNPKIRVHPASRSPSPDTSPVTVTDINNPHGLSPLPYDFGQFGTNHFDTVVDLPEVPNLDPSTASDSSDSDTPHNATLSDSDSDAEVEETTDSDIQMLSGMTLSYEQEGETSHNLDILRQTGYMPAIVENREAGIIHQPRAIYPDFNQISSVRFNLDADEPSIQSPDPDFYPDTPGSDIDSIMAMSCSSLPILKTPANFRAKELELHLPPQISASLLGGLSAPVSPLPLPLPPTNLFSNIENLNDLLSDSRPAASKIANSIGYHPPTRLLASTADPVKSGTLGRRGPSTISRAVTRSKSFPNLLAKRPQMNNEVRSDAMPGQARLIATMRSYLIEVIARVFVHLVTDRTGQIGTPSGSLSQTYAPAMYANRELDPQAQSTISALVDALQLDDSLATASHIAPLISSGPNPMVDTNHFPLPSELFPRRQTPS